METDIPEVDKGKLIIVTSKKIKYYAYEKESPQTVYEYNGNKIADKPLGTRIKNERNIKFSYLLLNNSIYLSLISSFVEACLNVPKNLLLSLRYNSIKYGSI